MKLKTAEEIYEEYNKQCYNGSTNKELFSVREMLELIRITQKQTIGATISTSFEELSNNEGKWFPSGSKHILHLIEYMLLDCGEKLTTEVESSNYESNE